MCMCMYLCNFLILFRKMYVSWKRECSDTTRPLYGIIETGTIGGNLRDSDSPLARMSRRPSQRVEVLACAVASCIRTASRHGAGYLGNQLAIESTVYVTRMINDPQKKKHTVVQQRKLGHIRTKKDLQPLNIISQVHGISCNDYGSWIPRQKLEKNIRRTTLTDSSTTCI